MVYADHYKMVEGKMEKHPVIDYQSGSLRDDFDFGSLWCIKAQALADYIAQPTAKSISLPPSTTSVSI